MFAVLLKGAFIPVSLKGTFEVRVHDFTVNFLVQNAFHDSVE